MLFHPSRPAGQGGVMVTQPSPAGLFSAADLAALDDRLDATDRLLESAFPGDDGRRQPVHTVYVPADRYRPELPAEWGAAALACVEANGGIAAVCAAAGLDDELAAQVGPRVLAKLGSAPIED